MGGMNLLVLLALCTQMLAVHARPAQEFSAGAASADITPVASLSNWITHKPYAEILEPIQVRALVLESGGKRVAIVSWELLYPMESAVAKVRAAIHQKTGIAQADILVGATHNHSAPWSPIDSDSLTKKERGVLGSLLSDPEYPAWADKVIAQTAACVQKADQARRPATLAISRAYVGDVIYNRRPIRPDGTVFSMTTTPDAYVMGKGLRFGKVDPVMTLLLVKGSDGSSIACLYHMACHAVVVYPSYDGISADWPGKVSAVLQASLGGEAIFLQGCAGDVNPLRRGIEARNEMAATIADRALRASRVAEPLSVAGGLGVARVVVQAPVKERLREELQRRKLPAEVQVITCGSLAIVGLPGEPLNGISSAIVEQSPFPHTIVLGYANGYGVQYVGLPGEQARGGYEMGDRNLGTDECGQLLVQSALRQLSTMRNAQRKFLSAGDLK